MFPLAAIVLFIGFALIVVCLSNVMNAPIVRVDDWVGGMGLAIFIAGLVLLAFAGWGWMGWGRPTWLIWVVGIIGALLLVLSWVGTFGDPLGRSPIENFPLTVIMGSGLLAAAIIAAAGVAGIAY